MIFVVGIVSQFRNFTTNSNGPNTLAHKRRLFCAQLKIIIYEISLLCTAIIHRKINCVTNGRTKFSGRWSRTSLVSINFSKWTTACGFFIGHKVRVHKWHLQFSTMNAVPCTASQCGSGTVCTHCAVHIWLKRLTDQKCWTNPSNLPPNQFHTITFGAVSAWPMSHAVVFQNWLNWCDQQKWLSECETRAHWKIIYT